MIVIAHYPQDNNVSMRENTYQRFVTDSGVIFWQLAHKSRDISQAETKIT